MLTLAGGMFFFAWLLGSGRGHTYEHYAIYFEGTVNGLGIGSPVRYLGVNVGSVDSISLDDKNPNRVLVIATVDNHTPIRQDTVAELKFQGITGVAYIDLNGTTLDSPELTKNYAEQYMVIQSQQTGIEKALNDIPHMIERLSELADRANRLLSDDNITAISGIMRNLDQLSGQVAGNSDSGINEIGGLMRDGRSAIQEIKSLVQSLKENPSQLIYKPAYRGYDVGE